MAVATIGKLKREGLRDNLLALKINVSNYTKTCNVKLDKTLFTLPNQSSLIFITSFLFESYDPVQFKENFKSCFPITSKKDEAGFLRAAYEWLCNLSQSCEEARIPRITKTTFTSGQGDRLCAVFLSFSTYILRNIHRSKKGQWIVYSPAPVLPETNKAILRVQNCLYSSFLEKQKKVDEMLKSQHEKALAAGVVLVNINKQLENKIKVSHVLTRNANEETTACLANVNATDLKLQDICRTLLNDVSNFYQEIDIIFEECMRAKTVMGYVSAGLVKDCLDGSIYTVNVSKSTFNLFRSQLQEANVMKLQDGDKLNFVNLLKFFNIALPKIQSDFISFFEATSGNLPIKLSSLEHAISELTNKLDDVENKHLPIIKAGLNDRENALGWISAEPKPLMFEGKLYNLQRTTPEINVNTSQLNFSGTPSIYKLSPVNYESLDSGVDSSPQLRRRVLERNLSLSPRNSAWLSRNDNSDPKNDKNKTLHCSSKQAQPLTRHGAHDVTLSKKENIRTTKIPMISNSVKPKQVQPSVRPKVVQLRSPQKRSVLKGGTNTAVIKPTRHEQANKNITPVKPDERTTRVDRTTDCPQLDLTRKFKEVQTLSEIESNVFPESAMTDKRNFFEVPQSQLVQDQQKECSALFDFASPASRKSLADPFYISVNDSSNYSLLLDQHLSLCEDFDISSELDASKLIFTDI